MTPRGGGGGGSSDPILGNYHFDFFLQVCFLVGHFFFLFLRLIKLILSDIGIRELLATATFPASLVITSPPAATAVTATQVSGICAHLASVNCAPQASASFRAATQPAPAGKAARGRVIRAATSRRLPAAAPTRAPPAQKPVVQRSGCSFDPGAMIRSSSVRGRPRTRRGKVVLTLFFNSKHLLNFFYCKNQ